MIEKSLVSIIKYPILILLILKRALIDYVTRPGDMTKQEFLSFHSVILVYILLITIMIFVEPIWLLVLYIGLIVFHKSVKG